MSLLKQTSSSFKEAVAHKMIPPEDIGSFATHLREQGAKIVTLNGSFDLLHPGHLEMIYQASQQGTHLLLLLNSDASIRAYKSPKRPINPLPTRLLMVAAFEMVYAVSWFEETTPLAILERIKPDVHVNGSEYGKQCIEADIVEKHGGKIHIVSLVSGYSSTLLIEKIVEQCV